MTREENIIAAADKAMEELWTYGVTYSDGFRDGAKWADSHPHWISVEDELPKDRMSILFTDGGYVYSGRYYCGRYYGDKGDWVDYCEVSTLIEDVTHWMPLTVPPKSSCSEIPTNCQSVTKLHQLKGDQL